jgi:hypothetical protein
MFFKSLRFFIVTLACSGLQLFALNQAQAPSLLQPTTTAPQKIVLWDIENVLLFVDSKKTSAVGNMLGYTPTKIQKELDTTLRPLHVKNFPESACTDIYAEIVEAWLTGFISSAQAHKEGRHYLEKHCSFLKKARLTQAIDIACTNKQATVFSPLNNSVALAHLCKNAGCIIGLCVNWNKELFDNLMRVKKATLGFFDEFHVSGNYRKLIADPTFYNELINKYGAANIVLISTVPETLKAAQSRGIKTINFTSAAAAERELRAIHFLS